MGFRKAVALLASGRGERASLDVPKQFAYLHGKPLFLRALEPFSEAAEWESLVITIPEGFEDFVASAVEEFLREKRTGFRKVSVVKGGSTRAESSKIAVEKLFEEVGEESLVLIHDAARPFPSVELINRVVRALESGAEAVVPAVPVRDSLIFKDGLGYFERDKLLAVQTPQGFHLGVLKRLFDEFWMPDLKDDASVFVLAGRKVALVEGDRLNFKITYPEDLKIAEVICEKLLGRK